MTNRNFSEAKVRRNKHGEFTNKNQTRIPSTARTGATASNASELCNILKSKHNDTANLSIHEIEQIGKRNPELAHSKGWYQKNDGQTIGVDGKFEISYAYEHFSPNSKWIICAQFKNLKTGEQHNYWDADTKQSRIAAASI